MQVNIEKIVDVAAELKIATLRAKEQGIIGYIQDTNNDDNFQVYDENKFKQIVGTRGYKIKKFDCPPYKYEYSVMIAGLNFTNIATEYLFKNDKIESEEI